MAQKAHSLLHTKWLCKYHIVFTPKYRRKVIYNQYRSSLGEIFHRLCSYKGVEIIEGHLMPDYVYMLVSIPPRISVSNFIINHDIRKRASPTTEMLVFLIVRSWFLPSLHDFKIHL